MYVGHDLFRMTPLCVPTYIVYLPTWLYDYYTAYHVIYLCMCLHPTLAWLSLFSFLTPIVPNSLHSGCRSSISIHVFCHKVRTLNDEILFSRAVRTEGGKWWLPINLDSASRIYIWNSIDVAFEPPPRSSLSVVLPVTCLVRLQRSLNLGMYVCS